MPQHKNEHRDAYIAAIVGGVVLILILLYLHGGTNAAEALSQPLGAQPVDASATPGASDYNYNIAPYNPGTPIQYAFPAMFGGEGDCGCGGNGVGPISPCSPITGTNLYNVNVAQYQTLAS